MPAGLSTASQPGPCARTTQRQLRARRARAARSRRAKGATVDRLAGLARRAPFVGLADPAPVQRARRRSRAGGAPARARARGARRGRRRDALPVSSGLHRRASARPSVHAAQGSRALADSRDRPWQNRGLGEPLRRTARTSRSWTPRCATASRRPDVAYTPAEKLQLARILLEGRGRRPHRDRVDARLGGRARGGAPDRALGARRGAALSASRSSATATARPPSTGSPAPAARVMNLLIKGSELHCRRRSSRMQPAAAPRRGGADAALRAPAQARASTSTSRTGRTACATPSTTSSRWWSCCESSASQRIYLPDTLGVFSPLDVTRSYVELMVDDLAGRSASSSTPTTITASPPRTAWPRSRAGARGVHTSVNGMGERTGNTRLAEVVAAIHDHTKLRTRVRRGRGSPRCRDWSRSSAARTSPPTRRSSGRDVFTQTGGDPRGRRR